MRPMQETPAADNAGLMEQAAQWVMQLSADDPLECAAARRDFDAWKQADPRHAEAAARLEGFLGRVRQLRDGDHESGATRAALGAVLDLGQGGRRTRKLKRLAIASTLGVLLGLAAIFGLNGRPPAYLLADLHTGTGQWQTSVLEDGTQITLNSASAVNLHYDRQRRVLQLVQGEILVQVRSAARLAEPATVVNAGQRVRITTREVGPLEPIDPRSIDDAWKYHQLVVQGQNMAEVLDMLNRYRPGLISYDRDDMASMHVAAVLPLDDIDRSLQLLGQSFPQLRVRRLSPYLVRVDAPSLR
jgi:transmembrane sensor